MVLRFEKHIRYKYACSYILFCREKDINNHISKDNSFPHQLYLDRGYQKLYIKCIGIHIKVDLGSKN